MSLRTIVPKLPAKDLAATKKFYLELGFNQFGGEYPEYLMLTKEDIEIHFFLFPDLDIFNNYGMCYIRVSDVDTCYNDILGRNIPKDRLRKPETKPWGQREFSIIDPDHNLLTFGEAAR